MTVLKNENWKGDQMEQAAIAKSLLAQIDGRSFLLLIRRNDGQADPRFESLIRMSGKIAPEHIMIFFPMWDEMNWVDFLGDTEIPAGYCTVQNEYCAYLYSDNSEFVPSCLIEDFLNFMNKIANNY